MPVFLFSGRSILGGTEHMNEHLLEIPDTAHEKEALINKRWRDEGVKLWSEEEGRALSLKECYEREIVRSKLLFEEVRKVADQEVPQGLYVLFVDMTHPGFMKRPEALQLDPDRLSKIYEAETGSPDSSQDFQCANIRYCFGFTPGDARFRTVKPFYEALPEDLSGCVGVILSGSEAYIKDDPDEERTLMTQKVLVFVQKVKEVGIPLFGICFGSQLIGSVCSASVDWIYDTNTSHERGESGLVLLYKTEAGKEKGSPLEHLPDTFYVHSNHQQEIKKESMPDTLEVLASSQTSQVQIVRVKESETILAIQNHIECGDTRADAIDDVLGRDVRNDKLFQGESSKARQVLCPHFLRSVGKYARSLQ
jgi:GMP synthase-like glutamine amidotransferase